MLGRGSYAQTEIKEAEGEHWFCSEDEARQAVASAEIGHSIKFGRKPAGAIGESSVAQCRRSTLSRSQHRASIFFLDETCLSERDRVPSLRALRLRPFGSDG